jgi:putative nucleotidyltransferase with HDIG domain
MLAMVNSPFYGLNRTVGTIKEAVMVLGFRGVRSLVLATGTAKFLQRDFSVYGHEPRGLWRHAVCVAAGARQLALRCGMPLDDAEQLFVSGLLHDIGKLLLVPYVQAEPAYANGLSVVEHERATVGLDHAAAGALVTAKWNLSEEIQQVIKAHHAPDSSSSRSVAVVRLADAVAHTTGIGYLDGCAPRDGASCADLAVLGVEEAEWGGVQVEMTATMEEAVAALGDLGS